MSYARFLLDGQTAILDDYLEVRPEAEAALRRLSASGRISVGPWMVQMDEFMVSGETIVRDLQFGLEQAARSTAARCRSATSPTSSGTSRRCRSCCGSSGSVTRSRGGASRRRWTRPASSWIAPDGSNVRCEYLYGSYSNGRDIPEDAKGLLLRAARLPAGARERATHGHVVDERDRPPDAATVAGPGRRRGQRAPGRLPLRRHVAAGVPRANSPWTGSLWSKASCARARAPTS